MTLFRSAVCCASALLTAAAALAQPAPHASAASAAAPAFDVAYRAWEAVTGIARHNGNPALGGECARTFRPFVMPGLKMQGRQDADVAAAACVGAARTLCTDASLARTADLTRQCAEFR